jgi:hypothetical protein
LKAAEKDRANRCSSAHGPIFSDISVPGRFSLSAVSANDTELSGETVLTGFEVFTPKGIEIFGDNG